jgi:hypothetical protein
MVIPSQFFRNHLIKVAELYGNVASGSNLSSPAERTATESALLDEITSTRLTLNTASSLSFLNRQRSLIVKTGDPKGAWAHIYYISFHQPPHSYGPTNNFYPVFLMSMDQQQCWLSMCIAAATEGISGRGGWSKLRGNRLRKKAELLGSRLVDGNGWVKGPINLGPGGSKLSETTGSGKSSARAYEIGSIIARRFNPKNPPYDLEDSLLTLFGFYDTVLEETSLVNESSTHQISEKELFEQTKAAITGDRAEKYFMDWIRQKHPEFGDPIDKTASVGLGYDIEFAGTSIKIEVKGCRRNIENLRVTEREWDTARRMGSSYYLAIVSQLDTTPKVDLIPDPYSKLQNDADKQKRTQTTFVLPHASVRKAVRQ